MARVHPRQTSTGVRIQRIAPSQVPSDTVSLARYLLGKVLVRRIDGSLLAGRIVETEAYLPDDPACHAYRGVTPRNRSLFLRSGRAYVYLCYGTSYLLNVSSETAGVGAGVLLRALEPLLGVEQMRRERSHVKVSHIARGPGRLTAALHVDRSHDGLDLFKARALWIGSDGASPAAIGCSARIGLTKAAHERLRFFESGSRYLSGTRILNATKN